MLRAAPEVEAVRFATPDSLEQFSGARGQESGEQLSVVGCRSSVKARVRQLKSSRVPVDKQAALEESFFLGLRLNRGVSLEDLRAWFGEQAIAEFAPVIAELVAAGLLQRTDESPAHSKNANPPQRAQNRRSLGTPDEWGIRVHLTPRGRLLSNEVFARFLLERRSAEPAPVSTAKLDIEHLI